MTKAPSKPSVDRLRLKRVYDPPARGDGVRVLVDRLWPRGLSREKAAVDEWMPDVAPSADLRRWFGHDPARWDEFRRRYIAELDTRPDAVEALAARVHGRRATLVFGARDAEHNQAVVLGEYLRRHRGRSQGST
ncbi:MAG: hypothetical protein ABS36_04535 [Acidobacteria bacterium SCN 69-37]|nr:MAG: hypothetical protein ABS36_04535 [Acidobacteria bacterium SCN 69-37]